MLCFNFLCHALVFWGTISFSSTKAESFRLLFSLSGLLLYPFPTTRSPSELPSCWSRPVFNETAAIFLSPNECSFDSRSLLQPADHGSPESNSCSTECSGFRATSYLRAARMQGPRQRRSAELSLFGHKCLSQHSFLRMAVVHIEMRPGGDTKTCNHLSGSNKQVRRRPFTSAAKQLCPVCTSAPCPVSTSLPLDLVKLRGVSPVLFRFRTTASQSSHTPLPARVRTAIVRLQSFSVYSMNSSRVAAYRAFSALCFPLSCCSSPTLMLRLSQRLIFLHSQLVLTLEH